MDSNQTLLDIINQQNIKIQQLENIIKEQNSNKNSNINNSNNQNNLHVEYNQAPIFEFKKTNVENINDSEYICLICNQLFTSKDIFDHSQNNKDHIDHCIHINKVKDQLLDINNNNNNDENSNNIFKKRLETLWSSLKRLSTTHSLLNSKINEITNHFKIYYDCLMSKEHSLKKEIQNDIDLINNDITHQINEIKSIINIFNINNKINNNINSDDSILEDTTNNYPLSSIIESIQQSESYNNFIENNKNTLFNNNNNIVEEYKINNNYSAFLFFLYNHNRNFNFGVLNPTEIHLQSNTINENLYIVKVNQQVNVCDQLQKIFNESIMIDTAPSALVIYGDLERIKQYYKRNNINKLEYNHNSIAIQQTEIKQTIIEVLKSNRIDILKYFIQELQFDIKNQFKPDVQFFRLEIEKLDLLAMSTIYSNLETIQFIETFGISKNIKWKYDKCLEVSPFSNNIKILQYFATKVIDMVDSEIIKNIYASANAALLGRVDMIEWISRNTPLPFEYLDLYFNNCMGIAAKNGHLETIKWLHENRTEGCTTDAMDYAAENRHLETIKWLHHNRTEGCTTKAMDKAASNGDLETIKWLHKNRTEGCTTEAMNTAVSWGHLQTFKWLHQNRTEGCTTQAMDYAAWKGNLEIVKWLHHNRTEGCTTDAMNYAAMKGDLETIKWLHHNRTEGCSKYAMNYAARDGHLETIKWLHQNRTEGCTTYAMNDAAKNGHLETIKWLHHNRTEGFTTNAMDCAAVNGKLETVKWLHENRTEGCTTNAMDYAARYGDVEIIKWLHENRTEGCTTDAMNLAAENGELETIKWLHHNRTEGCTTQAMNIAAENGHLETIKWLHHNRTEGCTTNAINDAAKNGHLEIIKWLHHNRTEGCTAKAMYNAQRNNHIEVFEWLNSCYHIHNKTNIGNE